MKAVILESYVMEPGLVRCEGAGARHRELCAHRL